MLQHTIKRIFIIRTPIDFRKGASSLTAIMYSYSLDPYNGDCLVCINRSRTSVKILCGNAVGVWLLERRFEGGRLSSPWEFLYEPTMTEVTVSQIAMLLDGHNFTVKKTVKPFKT